MRKTWMPLHLAGALILGAIGCRNQLDLRPPETAEVLASPGDADKRYVLPCSYPAESLASDPSKNNGNGIIPASASKRGTGMGPGTGGGGAGGGGMGPGG